MGTYWDLWGPIRAYVHLWGPMRMYGDLSGPMGTNGDVWGTIGTYGDLRGLVGTYGDLWGPIRTYGDLWGPIGTNGELLGPMGTYGVGGINFLHTHFDTPPSRPFFQASDLYPTYQTSCCVHCKNNMPYQTSNIRPYKECCHPPPPGRETGRPRPRLQP